MADPDEGGGGGGAQYTYYYYQQSLIQKFLWASFTVAGPDGGGGQNSPSTLEILIQIVYNCGGRTPLFEA